MKLSNTSKVVLIGAMLSVSLGANAQQVETNRPQVNAKPIALDWRQIKWPSLDFTRTPIPGGGALYSIPSASAQKFRIDLVFTTGIYTFAVEKRPVLGAASDLILQGGAGKRNFDELQRYLQENGINMWTELKNGYFQLSIEALKVDAPKSMAVLEDVLFKPRFDKDSLEYWKQQKNDEFESILDASTLSKQHQFIVQESVKIGLGNDHYFATNLKRRSKKVTDAITHEDVKTLHGELINKAGLNAVVSGNLDKRSEAQLIGMLTRLPRRAPDTLTWLPGRGSVAPSSKVRVAIIQKTDMTQAAVQFRYVFPRTGRLNDIERTRVDLLEEVFSSSGGVVGNDRFSKAMRADSGISYSSHAGFQARYVEPNTNVGAWVMDYQSPNERILESLRLARSTWETFRKDGITADELERARVSKMNMLLAREETIFDKASRFVDELTEDKNPSAMPLESELVKLEREKALEPVNQTLRSIVGTESVGTVVLFGNPSEDMIKQLKDDKDFEVVKIVSFSDLVKELQ